MTMTQQLSKKQSNLERIKCLSYANMKGRKVYICPKCKKQVAWKSHYCPFCNERYHFAIRVPLRLLRNVRNGIATKELHDYVHIYLFPKLDIFDQQYLNQYFTITRISQGTNGYATGTTQTTALTVNLQQAPVVGDVLILAFASGGATNSTFITVSSISQTNVAWSAALVTAENGSSATYYCSAQIFIGIVSASAGTTVTLTLSHSTTRSSTADICEYSGVATSGYLDQASTSTGANSNLSTGTTSKTTQNNELWVGCIQSYYAQTTPTNGFTLLDGNENSNNNSCAYLEDIVSSEGTAGSGTTNGSYFYYAGCIATFFAAASATNINLSDTGSGSDAVAVTASMPVSDAGSGSDTASITAKILPTSDTGQGSDSIASLQAQVPVSDSGAGSDAISALQAQIPLPDSGSGSDALSLLQAQVPVSDSGLGSDVANIAAQVPIADSAEGSDNAVVGSSVNVSDSGVGSDNASIAAQIPAIDVGLGTDSVAVGSTVNLIDSGLGSDAVAIQAQVLVADAGASFDSAIVNVSTVISDAGLGSDILAIAVPISVSDAGVGADTIVVVVPRLSTHAVVIQSETGKVTLVSEKGQVTLKSDSD